MTAQLASVDLPSGLASIILAWSDQDERAERLLQRVISYQRRSAGAQHIAAGLHGLVELFALDGRWPQARATASLADELGQTGHADALAGKLVTSWIDAACGRRAEWLAARNEIRDALPVWSGVFQLRCDAAEGLLALGEGNIDRALKILTDVRITQIDQQVLDPVMRLTDADLVEALWRDGQVDRARPIADELARTAFEAQRMSALAVARRCQGLVSDDFEEHFAEAQNLHDKVRRPFDEARTLLCWGERRRRDRRPRDAQQPLADALRIFERLDAEPWVRRTAGELAACGARVPRRAESTWTTLTNQEQQVAVAVAGGATNKEAAAKLFISRRTVEYHLQAVYRKLGIRTRVELRERLPLGQ